jgi:GH24 family phage-related lysozyme (muramidase)
MADVGRVMVREPGLATPRAYERRVHGLAAIYAGLMAAALTGLALIIWQARLLVTLSQRSNVETLVLAFFLIFFTYIAFLSLPGAWGALRVAYFALRRLASGPAEAERLKREALPKGGTTELVGALNVVLELEGLPDAPFRVPVADETGGIGEVVVDGARITFRRHCMAGSNAVLAFCAQQLSQMLAARGVDREVDIVEWKTLSDERCEQYLGMVEFARNLGRRLASGPLWPTVQVTAEEAWALTERLSRLCPALRDEGFLPDWEYRAEHKLPIIPEPLGLASLTRSEQRADPLASMGFILGVVIVVVAVLALLIWSPPWVPGS